MAKGFFTQGACVLLARPATLDELAALLAGAGFEIARRNDAAAPSPEMSGPSLVVGFRPEVNGYASIDTQDGPWPDHMGDATREVALFGAWSMGHYGPFAYPGNLERAARQAWAWPDAKDVPAQHHAFVRIRTSYVFGAADDDPVMPADCDPLAELELVHRIARAVMRHDAALAYFNPNGETLTSRAGMEAALADAAERGRTALDLWSHVRLLNPGNGWMIMDTVGLAQVDLPDLEACFPEDGYDPNAVAGFLRNCSLYLLSNGDVIGDGDTVDGPGGIHWRGQHCDDSLAPAPRLVIRWFPNDGSEPPAAMLGDRSS